ncbi:MAG TPA: hypothetical protein PKV94_07760 [Syntrophales bacterium]|nr:hypothetical protein [Syntrophales bacterium]HPN24885.1 hypothetical protein [Syntrophales bacterium]
MLKKVFLTAFVLNVLIICLPSSSSAAEAWVLWKKNEVVSKTGSKDTSWEIISGHPTYDTCQKAKAITYRTEYKIHYEYLGKEFMRPVENESLTLMSPNTKIILYFKCLPDTIDPRGPKK